MNVPRVIEPYIKYISGRELDSAGMLSVSPRFSEHLRCFNIRNPTNNHPDHTEVNALYHLPRVGESYISPEDKCRGIYLTDVAGTPTFIIPMGSPPETQEDAEADGFSYFNVEVPACVWKYAFERNAMINDRRTGASEEAERIFNPDPQQNPYHVAFIMDDFIIAGSLPLMLMVALKKKPGEIHSENIGQLTERLKYMLSFEPEFTKFMRRFPEHKSDFVLRMDQDRLKALRDICTGETAIFDEIFNDPYVLHFVSEVIQYRRSGDGSFQFRREYANECTKGHTKACETDDGQNTQGEGQWLTTDNASLQMRPLGLEYVKSHFKDRQTINFSPLTNRYLEKVSLYCYRQIFDHYDFETGKTVKPGDFDEAPAGLVIPNRGDRYLIEYGSRFLRRSVLVEDNALSYVGGATNGFVYKDSQDIYYLLNYPEIPGAPNYIYLQMLQNAVNSISFLRFRIFSITFGRHAIEHNRFPYATGVMEPFSRLGTIGSILREFGLMQRYMLADMRMPIFNENYFLFRFTRGYEKSVKRIYLYDIEEDAFTIPGAIDEKYCIRAIKDRNSLVHSGISRKEITSSRTRRSHPMMKAVDGLNTRWTADFESNFESVKKEQEEYEEHIIPAFDAMFGAEYTDMLLEDYMIEPHDPVSPEENGALEDMDDASAVFAIGTGNKARSSFFTASDMYADLKGGEIHHQTRRNLNRHFKDNLHVPAELDDQKGRILQYMLQENKDNKADEYKWQGTTGVFTFRRFLRGSLNGLLALSRVRTVIIADPRLNIVNLKATSTALNKWLKYLLSDSVFIGQRVFLDARIEKYYSNASSPVETVEAIADCNRIKTSFQLSRSAVCAALCDKHADFFGALLEDIFGKQIPAEYNARSDQIVLNKKTIDLVKNDSISLLDWVKCDEDLKVLDYLFRTEPSSFINMEISDLSEVIRDTAPKRKSGRLIRLKFSNALEYLVMGDRKEGRQKRKLSFEALAEPIKYYSGSREERQKLFVEIQALRDGIYNAKASLEKSRSVKDTVVNLIKEGRMKAKPKDAGKIMGFLLDKFIISDIKISDILKSCIDTGKLEKVPEEMKVSGERQSAITGSVAGLRITIPDVIMSQIDHELSQSRHPRDKLRRLFDTLKYINQFLSRRITNINIFQNYLVAQSEAGIPVKETLKKLGLTSRNWGFADTNAEQYRESLKRPRTWFGWLREYFLEYPFEFAKFLLHYQVKPDYSLLYSFIDRKNKDNVEMHPYTGKSKMITFGVRGLRNVQNRVKCPINECLKRERAFRLDSKMLSYILKRLDLQKHNQKKAFRQQLRDFAFRLHRYKLLQFAFSRRQFDRWIVPALQDQIDTLLMLKGCTIPKTEEGWMALFERETGKHAIWGGNITKQYTKWKETSAERMNPYTLLIEDSCGTGVLNLKECIDDYEYLKLDVLEDVEGLGELIFKITYLYYLHSFLSAISRSGSPKISRYRHQLELLACCRIMIENPQFHRLIEELDLILPRSHTFLSYRFTQILEREGAAIGNFGQMNPYADSNALSASSIRECLNMCVSVAAMMGFLQTKGGKGSINTDNVSSTVCKSYNLIIAAFDGFIRENMKGKESTSEPLTGYELMVSEETAIPDALMHASDLGELFSVDESLIAEWRPGKRKVQKRFKQAIVTDGPNDPKVRKIVQTIPVNQETNAFGCLCTGPRYDKDNLLSKYPNMKNLEDECTEYAENPTGSNGLPQHIPNLKEFGDNSEFTSRTLNAINPASDEDIYIKLSGAGFAREEYSKIIEGDLSWLIFTGEVPIQTRMMYAVRRQYKIKPGNGAPDVGEMKGAARAFIARKESELQLLYDIETLVLREKIALRYKELERLEQLIRRGFTRGSNIGYIKGKITQFKNALESDLFTEGGKKHAKEIMNGAAYPSGECQILHDELATDTPELDALREGCHIISRFSQLGPFAAELQNEDPDVSNLKSYTHLLEDLAQIERFLCCTGDILKSADIFGSDEEWNSYTSRFAAILNQDPRDPLHHVHLERLNLELGPLLEGGRIPKHNRIAVLAKMSDLEEELNYRIRDLSRYIRRQKRALARCSEFPDREFSRTRKHRYHSLSKLMLFNYLSGRPLLDTNFSSLADLTLKSDCIRPTHDTISYIVGQETFLHNFLRFYNEDNIIKEIYDSKAIDRLDKKIYEIYAHVAKPKSLIRKIGTEDACLQSVQVLRSEGNRCRVNLCVKRFKRSARPVLPRESEQILSTERSDQPSDASRRGRNVLAVDNNALGPRMHSLLVVDPNKEHTAESITEWLHVDDWKRYLKAVLYGWNGFSRDAPDANNFRSLYGKLVTYVVGRHDFAADVKTAGGIEISSERAITKNDCLNAYPGYAAEKMAHLQRHIQLNQCAIADLKKGRGSLNKRLHIKRIVAENKRLQKRYGNMRENVKRYAEHMYRFLVESEDIGYVVMESLNLSTEVRGGLGRIVQEMIDIEDVLDANELGVDLVEVDPAYTSKRCFKCKLQGQKSDVDRRFSAIWCICPVHGVFDAQEGAAVNIFLKSDLSSFEGLGPPLAA